MAPPFFLVPSVLRKVILLNAPWRLMASIHAGRRWQNGLSSGRYIAYFGNEIGIAIADLNHHQKRVHVRASCLWLQRAHAVAPVGTLISSERNHRP